MNEMNELILRLQKATGPDRELDTDISIAFWSRASEMWNGMTLAQAKQRFPTDIRGMSILWNYPYYTDSIDAALTLRPNGSFWRLFEQGECHASVFGPGVHSSFNCRGATPALALCIAALNSRKIADGN
jgi:hypothetical protein